MSNINNARITVIKWRRVLIMFSKKIFQLIGMLFLLIGMFLCNNNEIFAKKLYDSNGVNFRMLNAQQVKASHLLVVTKEQAEQIKQDIESGKITFEKAAAEHSKCPSGAKGGDLGFFGKGAMVPEFEQAAFTLDVGKVSEPVKTQFGWHLIVVTDKK